MKSGTNALGWTSLDWQILASLVLLGSLLFFPGLGSYGIIDPSDGLYSEGAREMVESGNYITYLSYWGGSFPGRSCWPRAFRFLSAHFASAHY
jgi:hypothetical protein